MRKRSWNEIDLRKAAASSGSYRQTLQKLGLTEAGGNYTQIKKYIAEFNISTKHFHGKAWSKGRKIQREPVLSLKEILVQNSHYQSFKLKKRLFTAGIKNVHCEMCGWAKLSNDGRVPLELDHINGIHTDNRIENLRILCPNCHSLQPTHRGRNKKKKGQW